MKIVADYMTEKVVTIDCERTVFETVMIMRQGRMGSLLVTENNLPCGIFTERDLLNKVDFANQQTLQSMKIRDVMTRDLKTVPYNDPYTNVIELMQRYNIRHMPVEKDGKIIGIVSLRDLLRHYYEDLEVLFNDTVTALSSAVEKRDPYTAGHQERVKQLSCAIASELNLPQKQISGVSMSAVIHDVGKVYIPTQILNKPGKLNDAELTLIKVHPQVGYDILKGIDFPWPIAEVVLQHHEKIDGSGYPQGIKNDKILFEAKIIGVADVVEAMASHRPYRPSLGIDKALQEIERFKGSKFDAQIVDTCVKLFKEKNFQFAEVHNI